MINILLPRIHQNITTNMAAIIGRRTNLKKIFSRAYCSALDTDTIFFHPSFTDKLERTLLHDSFKLHRDFINEDEEKSLESEVVPVLKRLRYEADHWDAAILGYRETEKKDWGPENALILQRVRETAFPKGTAMPLVHVLDLKADGVIKPHVDSVKFCGDTIAGLSLLSDSVMRLAKEKEPLWIMDVLLPRRSLYIMTGVSRYEYTHAILGHSESFFKELPVEKNRRISIICRNDPTDRA